MTEIAIVRPHPFRRMMSGWAPRAALALLLVFVLLALLAPLLAPHDPYALSSAMSADKNLPPSFAHLLGTDPLSRDVASRMLYGARVSLGIGVLAVVIAVTFGSAWGAAAGFGAPWLDALLMRTVDGVVSIPRVLLLLVVRATFGPPSITGIALLLGFTGWMSASRIVRQHVLAERRRDYVLAAHALGVPRWRILLRHIVPAIAPHILVAATLAFAAVIPLEAGLSFLDLGVPSPAASWGNIIMTGAEHPVETWWLVLFPGLAIAATVLAANTLGERLRAVLDPRQEGA